MGWNHSPCSRDPYRLIKGQMRAQMEKAMAPHSSTLAWKIPWMEKPGRLQSMGSLESDMTGRLHFHFSLPCIGEGNGNPLQCSYLENPRDGEAWWAVVSGVTQSQTQLKWLSSMVIIHCSKGPGRGRHELLQNLRKWKLLSHVQHFVTRQTIQSMKFSRPEYWSG